LILLSLGTHQQPFPRALDLMESVSRAGHSLVVQHGSTRPRADLPQTTWLQFIAFDDLVDKVAHADSVICHAGIGTIMTALQSGHRPVVIPRLAMHDEHVDDHQLDIATRLAERGLVRCVTTETDLAPLLSPRTNGSNGHVYAGSGELRAAVSAAVEDCDDSPRRLRWRRGG
jgi:UDP-N-acetylglucosamine transferase subunit ALG13